MNKPNNTSATLAKIESGLARRYASERRFINYGRLAIAVGCTALLFLFISIFSKGYSAFTQTEIFLTVDFNEEILGFDANIPLSTQLKQLDFDRLLKQSIYAKHTDVTTRRAKILLRKLYSSGAVYELRQYLEEHPHALGKKVDLWVLADDAVDVFYKADFAPQEATKLQSSQIELLKMMAERGELRRVFNSTFFQSGDSREPEQAGIRGAILGTLLTLTVTFVLVFPVGVAAAIYLEEFAPRHYLTHIIEVNINNLAAVPSVIFGLLGLAVFINIFGLPRSTPLVGGLVLALMTLPTIIIASRTAIQSIPPSISEAALGIGASPTQVVFHHLLPLAMPAMLTGAIIGMARALGETAPLLMIGMVAFIVDIPDSLTDVATVLPVQIYLWADSPEKAFVAKTSAAIIVLLMFLIMMNFTAVWLRRKWERRW